MIHKISAVAPDSIAKELGIEPGDALLAINGEEVADIVDYEAACAVEELTLTVRKKDGEEIDADVEKEYDEGLGLSFENGLMSKLRVCCNNCVFCFVDQMRPGLRDTLYVKDDDWRMSFIMGNFVTLTNVSDAELQRIIERRVSPLYISVHTTDPKLRVKMMRQPRAGIIMQQLSALTSAGIRVHCQIVLVPGWNDGSALEDTLSDLYSLGENVLSVAVVPVGLSNCRQGLEKLTGFDSSSARSTIDEVRFWQERAAKHRDNNFVHASDEFYCIAGWDVPKAEVYDDYPQIENGVGMMRKFEDELREALLTVKPGCAAGRRAAVATGVSAAPWMRRLCDETEKVTGMKLDVIPVKNGFFGDTVTVAGLLTASDLTGLSAGTDFGEKLLITRSMMRETEEVFLDGGHISDVESALSVKVVPVHNDGEEFLRCAIGGIDE